MFYLYVLRIKEIGMKLHVLAAALLGISVLFALPTEVLAQAILPVSRGGTGSSSFTAGSVLFSDGSIITQDNFNFFWDDINNRLGIGTSTPSKALDVSSDAIINGITVGRGGNSAQTNTALGHETLLNNNVGYDSAAVGFRALRDNSNGDRNSAFGAFTLYSNTIGSENTALGWRAFMDNTTGSGNIAIGMGAGKLQSDSNFLTNANTSIYIGKNVRGFDNNDINSIVIGTDAIGAGANKAVIGNSSVTDVYFGSSSANAYAHAKALYLGSSSAPGCIIMGDSDGSGVTYLTANDGVLTASSTKPSACP